MNRLLATMILSCGAATAAAEAVPSHWTRPAEPFEIFDDVYYVGSEGLAAYLFATDEGLALLDVGLPENVELVEANIRKLGFHVSDVRYLINSHAHFDHSGGLARLKADSGATLVASAEDRFALENGVYPGWEDRPEFDFPPVAVDRVIGDGESLTLGDLTLTAHLTPGHSPGCTSWSFTARNESGAHRALVFCSASVAANRLAPDPQYPGIVEDYQSTFRRMETMTVDVWLAPHPEQFGLAGKRARLAGGDADAFVDPAEKDRRMAAFEQAFAEAFAEALARASAETP